jgi:hypothetical protein
MDVLIFLLFFIVFVAFVYLIGGFDDLIAFRKKVNAVRRNWRNRE